jgi:uncharacterized protein YyaL (SSP411 family)
LLLSVCLALALFPSRALVANQLKDHPSPYLALHGADPVDWHDWGPAVVARARQENKPLFVSSGYFACHWCHVMQRESFSDRAIAALLNRYFIPVKVDRELHPALDAYLIRFVESTRGSAGWPLNVFLTPEGYPLLGLTYVPAETLHRVLVRLSSSWSSQADRLSDLARAGAAELDTPERRETKETPRDLGPVSKKLLEQALAFADELQGGFGQQSRFPMVPQMAALLELQARQPAPRLEAFLRLTLSQMATLGMRDQLGGGFFRYTVDPDWRVPHFEKMLYDQALNAMLYLRAGAVLGNPKLRDVAKDTLDFVVRRMRADHGGYVSSFSAVDGQGVEGGNYLWSAAQLARVLDEGERPVAERLWGMQGEPGFDAGHLPVAVTEVEDVARDLGITPEAVRIVEDRARAKLLLARAARPLPVDGKPVAAWNGLLLSALAAGAEAIGGDYRQAAAGLAAFLVERLWDGERLHRSFGSAGWMGEASLEDYAFVARGLADWSAAGGSPQHQAFARRLVADAWKRFFSDGWRPLSEPLIPGMDAEPALADSPLPSPSATLIQLTLELADPATDGALLRQAEAALGAAYPVVEEHPFGYVGSLRVLERWRDAERDKPGPVRGQGEQGLSGNASVSRAAGTD